MLERLKEILAEKEKCKLPILSTCLFGQHPGETWDMHGYKVERNFIKKGEMQAADSFNFIIWAVSQAGLRYAWV